MNDTEYGLTAGVYTRDRARAEAILRPRRRRQRLLELLRPGQPAPALDRPQTLGHRIDAVDARHPHVPAAQGLAPARAGVSVFECESVFEFESRVGLGGQRLAV